MEDENKTTKKVSYEQVKALIEDNGIDVNSTNAKKLLDLAGHGGTGTYQKYLDIIRAEHITAIKEADSPDLPAAPAELNAALWALAYTTAQAEVAKQFTRITIDRDMLQLRTAAQAADIEMYINENTLLEDKIKEFEPLLALAHKTESETANQANLNLQQHRAEINNLQEEVKRIAEAAETERTTTALRYKIERETLEATIDRLNDHLSEIKSLHIAHAANVTAANIATTNTITPAMSTTNTI